MRLHIVRIRLRLNPLEEKNQRLVEMMGKAAGISLKGLEKDIPDERASFYQEGEAIVRLSQEKLKFEWDRINKGE